MAKNKLYTPKRITIRPVFQRHFNLSISQLYLLSFIIHFLSRHDELYLSSQQIGDILGMSKRSVQNNLKYLEKRGLIEISHYENFKNETIRYILLSEVTKLYLKK